MGNRQKITILDFSLLKEKKTKGKPVAKIRKNSILASLPRYEETKAIDKLINIRNKALAILGNPFLESIAEVKNKTAATGK
jgi:hypothetical protein